MYDIGEEDGDHGHLFSRQFILWPDRWKAFPNDIPLEWQSIKYTKENLDRLPSSRGVYAFVVQPNLAGMDIRYLMYVGKAEKQDLCVRCGQYLSELTSKKPRRLIKQMLCKWGEFLHLYFSELEAEKTTEVEEHLLAAFMPPANTKLPGNLAVIAKDIYRG